MTEQRGGKLEDHVHAELLALQNLAASDIAFYKQQQWQATNYVALLYVSIIAAGKLVEAPLHSFELIMLLVITLIVLATGLSVINELDMSLAKSRDRLPAARKYFNKEISLRAYACEGNPNDALMPSSEKPSLKKLFQLAMIIGFLLTSWLLFRM